jgi:hypothetical protein
MGINLATADTGTICFILIVRTLMDDFCVQSLYMTWISTLIRSVDRLLERLLPLTDDHRSYHTGHASKQTRRIRAVIGIYGS